MMWDVEKRSPGGVAACFNQSRRINIYTSLQALIKAFYENTREMMSYAPRRTSSAVIFFSSSEQKSIEIVIRPSVSDNVIILC